MTYRSKIVTKGKPLVIVNIYIGTAVSYIGNRKLRSLFSYTTDIRFVCSTYTERTTSLIICTCRCVHITFSMAGKKQTKTTTSNEVKTANTEVEIAVVENVTPSYIMETIGLEEISMYGDPANEGEYPSFRVLNILPKKGKNGLNLFIRLEATSIRTTDEYFVYEEERPINGVKNLGELKIELAKRMAQLCVQKGHHFLPQYANLFANLKRRGWTPDKLMMNYLPSKIIKKLGHIIADSGLQETFLKNDQLDITKLVGQFVSARISENGILMSLSGEAQENSSSGSTTQQSDVLTDDSGFEWS